MEDAMLVQQAVSTARVVFDCSQWPLVISTWPPYALSAKEFTRHLDVCRHIVEQILPDEYLVHISVVDNSVRPNALQRKEAAEWWASPFADAMKTRGAAVYVVERALIRGALHATFLLQRPTCETKIFPTLDVARTWAKARMRVVPRDKAELFRKLRMVTDAP
jgi:hypothetical protein